jgi:hypothetical protein
MGLLLITFFGNPAAIPPYSMPNYPDVLLQDTALLRRFRPVVLRPHLSMPAFGCRNVSVVSGGSAIL